MTLYRIWCPAQEDRDEGAIRFDTSSVAVAQMFRDIAAELEKKEEPR